LGIRTWRQRVPWRRNRDAANRHRFQILLGAPGPILIVYLDRFGAISSSAQRSARRIARCCAQKKYSYVIFARFNRGGSEVVNDGERPIRVARVHDVDGRPFTQLPDYPITRLSNYPIHLPEHVFDAIEQIPFVLFVGMRARLELFLG
jgi:hypothetical protein